MALADTTYLEIPCLFVYPASKSSLAEGETVFACGNTCTWGMGLAVAISCEGALCAKKRVFVLLKVRFPQPQP